MKGYFISCQVLGFGGSSFNKKVELTTRKETFTNRFLSSSQVQLQLRGKVEWNSIVWKQQQQESSRWG